MYEELIKQMRSVYQAVDCPYCPLVKDCMTLQSVCAFTRAADAIEELSYKYQKALGDLVKQAEPPKEET